MRQKISEMIPSCDKIEIKSIVIPMEKHINHLFTELTELLMMVVASGAKNSIDTNL